MDLATHALAGLAVGAAASRRVPLVPALAVGAIASVLPDLDVVLWFVDLRLYYEWHRVLTHTVFALPAIAACAALAGLALDRRRSARANNLGVTTTPARFAALFPVAAVSLLLHLSLDFLCDFPLRLLWPFSRYDFALYLISYSHPAFAVGFSALAILLLYPLARSKPGRAL